jgi:hypothetical protein
MQGPWIRSTSGKGRAGSGHVQFKEARVKRIPDF